MCIAFSETYDVINLGKTNIWKPLKNPVQASGFPNSERLLSVNATVVNHWFQEMMWMHGKMLNPNLSGPALFFLPLFQRAQHFCVETCQHYRLSLSCTETYLPKCNLHKQTINHECTRLIYLTVESIIRELSRGYWITWLTPTCACINEEITFQIFWLYEQSWVFLYF